MIKKIVLLLASVLLVSGLAAGAASAAPPDPTTPTTAAVAQAAPTGIDHLVDHSCYQQGVTTAKRVVICGDIYERIGASGAFFWGRAQYVCANGATVVRCDLAKGLQYFYTSGYGWSGYVRFACPEMFPCSNDRNYQNNPTFNQEFPTPSCRTLEVKMANVTMTVQGMTFTIASYLFPYINFCV